MPPPRPPMPPDHDFDVRGDRRYRYLAPDLAPATECLADVVVRMLPFWYDTICPDLVAGRTVLVSAHGNSLRALIKHLDGISDADIAELEIPTGVPIVYQIDQLSPRCPSGSSATPSPSPPQPRRYAARASAKGRTVPPTPASLRDLRAQVLRDRELTGTAWCRRYATLTGEWLTDVFARASGGDAKGLALLAVGGYGRATLAPGSDLDLLLVHEGKRSVKAIADALWYPIWDAGMPLDHSVRTPREIRSTMDSDIKVALGLLDARLVAGDRKLADAVLTRVAEQWKTRTSKWVPVLDRVTRERHARFGDLAFLLEPDLKEARGGLRDLQLLRSIGRVAPVLAHLLDDPDLARADEILTRARVELQRPTAQATNVLLLQDQDAVAARLAFDDADFLMAAVADAGRAIAWTSDDGWRRLESGWPARTGGPPGGTARSNRVWCYTTVKWSFRRTPIRRRTPRWPCGPLRHRPSWTSRWPAPPSTVWPRRRPAPSGVWPPETLHAFVRLLGAGRPAIAAVESLDQRGIWLRYLPEWAVRNRPQRNALHRFTVDRHLLETAAGAAAHQSSVARPDLLLLGALFHDIGKGRGGDHTDVGISVLQELGPRLGLDPADVAELEQLVRHHLLLPDAATRRDLDDPSTARTVAAAVGTDRPWICWP